MAEINIREIIGNDDNEKLITFVKAQGPAVKDAETRLNALREKLDELQHIVNNTNVGNTSADWQNAYSALTIAFSRCSLQEKKIIVEGE